MSAPKPVPSKAPHPDQLLGDYQQAEMSFASSLVEEELKDPGREVLVMTVDLGNELKDKLIVHEGERPEELALSFGRKHGLSERLVQALEGKIRVNLAQVMDEEEKADSSLAPSYAASETGYRPKPTPKSYSYRQTTSQSSNIGERLYVKGMQHKGSMDLQLQRARHVQETEASRELTFAPKLTRPTASPLPHSEDALLLQAQLSQRQLEAKRREVLQAQEAQCTFQPAICPRYVLSRSEEMSRKQSREASDRFDLLYQQAEVRRAKIAQTASDFIKNSCPFAPDINVSHPESQSEHIEKLYTSRRPVEAALDRERMRLFGKFDPETGRELYKPRTGRAPALQASPI